MQVELKNLSFSYQNKFIIKKASYIFKPGQIHFINGKNGSGKTTLLKLIATFISPTHGDIKYNALNFKDFKIKNRSDISYVTHLPMLYPELTLGENFKFFRKLYNIDKNTIDLRAEFNLSAFNDIQVKKFSRGMKQKASIALSLLSKASIFLFDEPFSGLDLESQDTLRKYIVNLSKNEDKLVFLISHHIDEIENSIYYNLENGKVEINN